MTVKTITQLPKQDNPVDGCWFGVSVPNSDSTFTSKKLRYGDLSANCAAMAKDIMISTFNMKNGSNPINISGMYETVNILSSQDAQVSGQKTFTSVPLISVDSASYPTESPGYLAANVSKVNDLISQHSASFSTEDSMIADGNPLTHNIYGKDEGIPEQLEYQTTIGANRNKFYFWRIDKQDSSKFVYDVRSNTTDGYEEMRDDGNLVVWGWLADNGNVAPEMAWVGLFAPIKYEGGDTTQVDVPICIQPWIRGQYASTLQYVGFNIPVRKGLRLKIKTGFPVNNANSGFANPGTMTFVDRNIPNAFFGYIVKGSSNS